MGGQVEAPLWGNVSHGDDVQIPENLVCFVVCCSPSYC